MGHKKSKAETTLDPDISVKQNAHKPTFVQKPLQQSKCELCDQIFTGDQKYKTIQMLLTHKATCYKKRPLDTQYRTKRECDECGYSASNENNLQNPPKKKRSSSNEKKNTRNFRYYERAQF